MSCTRQESGAVELYFYDELDRAERHEMSVHLRACRECASALEDLAAIRTALASRPDVSMPASGDWHRFMARLDAAVTGERSRQTVAPFQRRTVPAHSVAGLLAMAALLAIVTLSVVFVARQRSAYFSPPSSIAETSPAATDATPVATTGLRLAGEKHFERSKLVVLGLAARDTDDAAAADWTYERELATSLLNDTRLYRMAAEQRGLMSLAGVMRDLELVLLEASMAEESDTAALGQIQRLIQKRGLIEKMDTVASVGM